MTTSNRKRCVVAYATRGQCHMWSVDLPRQATVADALAAARAIAANDGIPWDSAPVGIFGELCHRNMIPIDGDRIEIYRPLANDPRERRRRRVRQLRRSSGPGSADV
jgi:uncharacterized protein